ncbi:fibrinogen beta chain [Lampris incognitus]|uniref:fibrinogen beta chain n=1 Tax=Lampris incognitus TaxID=2546036 RepID=UPI0024B48270|nr:fibrinogen beta chain [Lampris incognitus]
MRTRTLLFLCVCVCAAWAQGNFEYDDDYEPVRSGTHSVDARGHRPVNRGRETYNPVRYVPPPVSVSTRYRGRPTSAPTAELKQPEELEQPEAGGCLHISAQMGVLCPNGCELKSTIVKQERNVMQGLSSLRNQVDALSGSSNNIYNYVVSMSGSLRERQQVVNGNNKLVNQYTDSIEEQHVFIKETVDTVFPSNIRILQGILDKIRKKIQKLERAVLVQSEQCEEPCKTTCPIPVVSGKECEDIYRRGGRDSQMYLIQPDPLYPPYKVFCDQTTQNGGWLLIQNRQDGSVDFGRRWDDYRLGFGNIAFDVGKGHCETPGEYWLGNDRISKLTRTNPNEVLIEMEDWAGGKVHAQYKQFSIQPEVSNYILSVGTYSGNGGNSLMDGATELFGENRTMTIHNGMMFSTYDRDNDKWTSGDPTKQCSREDGGGWWYNRCHAANPNGRYYMGGSYTAHMAKHGTDDGIVWMNWKGSWYSLKAISMKIRPYFASR